MKKLFLTVGVQLPFDRLVKVVSSLNNIFEVRGQVGDTNLSLTSNYKKFINEDEYNENVRWADAIVAHAGMGSVLTGIEYSKKIFLLPRLSRYGEHRNDHQLDTVHYLGKLGKDECLISVYHTADDLYSGLINYSNSKCQEGEVLFNLKSRLNLVRFIKNEI